MNYIFPPTFDLYLVGFFSIGHAYGIFKTNSFIFTSQWFDSAHQPWLARRSVMPTALIGIQHGFGNGFFLPLFLSFTWHKQNGFYFIRSLQNSLRTFSWAVLFFEREVSLATVIVENMESMDSVDLTCICRVGVSQLYCSFDVALMQLCCRVDASGMGIWVVFFIFEKIIPINLVLIFLMFVTFFIRKFSITNENSIS